MPPLGSPYADTSDMYAIHTMFRREFGLLPGLVRAVAAGDEERAQIIAGHFRLVELVLSQHHGGEDAVLWPALLARAPKEVDLVVHLMEGHHAGLEKHLAEIEPLIRTWTSSMGTFDGKPLAQALERLAVALHEHMGLEERLILPLAERHVFAAEWEKMIADEAAQIGPDIMPTVIGMMMYESGIEVVPEPLREALGELAPKAYAAHCEQVYGTTTPPRSSDIVIGTPYVGVADGPAAAN